MRAPDRIALAAAAITLLATPARAQTAGIPPRPAPLAAASKTAPAPAPSASPVAATDGSGVFTLSDVRQPNFAAACDAVFVADGYPAEEQARFFTDAKAMSAHIDGDSSAAPLRSLKTFNYHYVFVPSPDRGCPFAPGTAGGNTPCKTYINQDTMLRCDTAAADKLATKYAPDVDVVIIVARFADGAGDGTTTMRANSDIQGQGSRVRIPRDADGALIHELGHALFALGDEYGGHNATIPAATKNTLGVFPNLTFDSTGSKWAKILQGAVEGGAEWNHGIWHPTSSCKMNNAWDPAQTFCPVCLAVMGSLPTAKPTDPTVAFSGDQPAPNVAATVTPAGAGPTWGYYVAVRKATAFGGSGDEVVGEWVEPGPQGQLAIGPLPAGDYVAWVQASNPAGVSGWTTKSFTVTGTLPAGTTTASASSGTAGATTTNSSSPVATTPDSPAVPTPHSGGMPPRPTGKRTGLTQAVASSGQ